MGERGREDDNDDFFKMQLMFRSIGRDGAGMIAEGRERGV